MYKFIKHPNDNELSLDQFEYEYDKFEQSINNKNILIIRKDYKLNSKVNLKNLLQYVIIRLHFQISKTNTHIENTLNNTNKKCITRRNKIFSKTTNNKTIW